MLEVMGYCTHCRSVTRNNVDPMKEEEIWYKNAVIYELHVRSFADSSADGIGDFRGLTEKLGYFEELGVTALWLLPFYPSPLRDDGYDIADYYSVNPNYGTLDDFRAFLEEAHRRGLRVITELVINHSSDQNPLFQRARRAPVGSVERDFYVWSDTPDKFEDARIIFKDFETSNWAWDPVANAYYWHRFYSHQPDLNFDSPHVREEVIRILDFWLDMGVDGLRLDAVPYLFEREGTSCENLPETHAYLRELRSHVDKKYPGRMLLAEANQWPEDAVAYFGDGDECHMEFHFPLMPRLFMALQQEDRFPIIDILDQTPAIPSSCQWAIFLRNHDELTLEMVTDEERDYMVRIYAQDARARINLGIRRRLAPLLGNNRRKIELINSLLLSLPGTPIIYYGDEIGMGDNFYLGDRHGVRTPMQWSADRNAGFSRANPQQLFLPVIIDPEFHYETVNVDVQQKNLSSLFWWMRRILKLRQQHPAFSSGEIEFLPGGNPHVLAFVRKHDSQTILVTANLSRFTQAAQLDLRAYRGHSPKELFGSTVFPEITDELYLITLGPHGFYWMELCEPVTALPDGNIAPEISLPAEWSPALLRKLESRILPAYIRGCRWFGAKHRVFRDMKISAEVPIGVSGEARLLLLELAFVDGPTVIQALPLAIASEDSAHTLAAGALIATFESGEVLVDALYLGDFRMELLQTIASGQKWPSEKTKLVGKAATDDLTAEHSRLLGAEQSNTSAVYDNAFALKFFRGFEAGSHPDAEILRALTAAEFPNIPQYLGEISCNHEGGEGVLCLLTDYVENQGDGWAFTLDSISRYFERALSALADSTVPDFGEVIGGDYTERARQLGECTGRLHIALASIPGAEFELEPFTGLYQRSLYQSLRTLARRTETELGRQAPSLPDGVRGQTVEWLKASGRLLEFYGELLNRRLTTSKIRVHGDYHLGQVLNTGKDFVILDFEGEPRRSLGERLLKRSPLVDVAGMLRSFDYAVQTALSQEPPDDQQRLQTWAALWLQTVQNIFLEGYLESTAGASFLPEKRADLDFLLRVFVLDKAVYEIGYELSYRPEMLPVPLGAALRLLRGAQGKE